MKRVSPFRNLAGALLFASMLACTFPISANAETAEEGQIGGASRSVGSVGYADAEPLLAAGLSLGTPIALAAIGQPLILNVGITYPLATLGAGTGHILAGDPTRALAVAGVGAAIVGGSALIGMAWDDLTVSPTEARPRKWTGIALVSLSWPIYSAWAAWDAYWTAKNKIDTSSVGK